jgi:hypothetical protein
VYLEHGAYYFRPIGGKRVRLSDDLGEALSKYGALIANAWALRTLGDVIDRYRVEVLPLKRSKQTREDEGRALDRLKTAFGHMLPDGLTAQHCYKYMDKRLSKDGKRVPVAARHEIVLLGHILKKAIKWGAATTNAAHGLEHEKKPGKRRQVPMEWVNTLKGLATPRMCLAIDWAVMIGQRRGDLLTLTQANLREDGIYVEQGKTGAKLLLEYSPDVQALIARSNAMSPQIPREYLIRKGNGKPYSADGFSSNWKRLMKKHTDAGGEHFTFHDLRSVSADGADTVEEARDRLGHKSSETTQRFYRRGVTKAKPRS